MVGRRDTLATYGRNHQGKMKYGSGTTYKEIVFVCVPNRLRATFVTKEWDSVPMSSCLPTTYRPPTDHLPTINRPLTGHLLTDHLPTDHLPTTYQPCTDHFFMVQLVHNYPRMPLFFPAEMLTVTFSLTISLLVASLNSC